MQNKNTKLKATRRISNERIPVKGLVINWITIGQRGSIEKRRSMLLRFI